MPRLIDADTKLTVLMHDEEWYTEEMTVDDLISKFVVETPPTIDAVPVVRCKDCKFYVPQYDKKGFYCGNCQYMQVAEANGFCHMAERKEE